MFGRIDVVLTAKFDERAWSAIAAASSGGRLHLAWAGQDALIRLASSEDGFTFSAPAHLEYKSVGDVPETARKARMGGHGGLAPMRPGLAPSAKGVDLALRPLKGRITVLRATGLWFRWDEIETGGRTAGSPSLAPLGDEVILAWTGSDGHLNLATSRGRVFGEPLRLDYTSRLSPALSTFGSRMALAWTGTDMHLNLAVGPIAPGVFSSEWKLEETSHESPAVCAMARMNAIAWVGTDDHLNVAFTDAGAVRTSLRLDERTFYEPALVSHAGALFLVWTGTKGEIGIVQLRAPAAG
ncbi:MAG: hypothetical protein ACRD12_14770 [Acidimicrobiales bacterium]